MGLRRGGESVLVNGAVFKTVSETVRTGSGRFDSYTPPPEKAGGSRQEAVAGVSIKLKVETRLGFAFVILDLALVSHVPHQIANR